MSEPAEPRRLPGRRDIFVAAGAAATAGVVGWGIGRRDASEGQAQDPTPTPSVPPAEGRAGITSPPVPQRHALVTVLHVQGDPAAVVSSVRDAVATLAPATPDAGVRTVTVGYGARVAQAVWPDRAAADMTLPAFAKDTAEHRSGGDVVLQVCAETGAAVIDATAELRDAIGGDLVWERAGFRDAPTDRGTTRTPSGFIDGIVNPRTAEELGEGVWTDTTHQDTYAVFRRMQVHRSFADLPVGDQEQAIGRRRGTGAPLSGGGPDANVDLFAKADDGTVLTPLASHTRRAHPANIGRALMLRRSYVYDPGAGMGLVFIAFLNDPQTFVMTQRRLDEADDFLAHTTADAAGVFFVPGAD